MFQNNEFAFQNDKLIFHKTQIFSLHFLTSILSKTSEFRIKFKLFTQVCNFGTLKYILNSLDFFATATPCNPLGRLVLTHSAPNDKIRRHWELLN